MADVIIRSDNRDFTDALAQAVKRELELSCEVMAGEDASLEVAGAKWPVSLPVRLNALLADIEHAHKQPQNQAFLQAGAWRLSLQQKILSQAGTKADIVLTDKETNILQLLMEKPGHIVDKESLLKTVWGMESALDTHTLETHIYRLRNKFREAAGEELIAASEGGYKWQI